MKRLLFSLCVCCIMLLTAGCGRGADGSYARKYANDSTTLTNVAWRLHDEGAPLDSCIAVQQEAVDLVRRGESDEDPVAVLEQMGMFRMAQGRFDAAMRCYMEARDSMLAAPFDSCNNGPVKLYGDISLLWQRLGAPREALAFNDSAMAESRRRGDALLTDLYMFRADIYDELGRPDSAVYCYDMALRSVDSRETNADKSFLRGWAAAEKGIYQIMRFPQAADTVGRAVALIEDALPLIGDESDTAMARFSLGMGRCLLGDNDAGLSMMEHAAAELREQGDPEYYTIALKGLMRIYARLGMSQKLTALYPEMEQAADSIFAQTMRESLAGAQAQYQMQSAELEAELLHSRLEAAREHMRVLLLAGALAALLAAGAAVVIVRRYRRLRRAKQRLDSDVMSLTRHRDEILGHNDVLRSELASQRVGKTDTLNEPTLNTVHDVRHFRQVFEANYPGFCPALRLKYPKITVHDELLCMMIYMGYGSEETAALLGMSRQSVNTARYRMRRRLGIDRSVDLNEFIKSLSVSSKCSSE